LARTVQRIALVWLAFVLALVVVQILVPQRSGFLELTTVFEPFILLSGLVAAPLALLGGSRAGVILSVLLVGLALLRWLPGWLSLPPATTADRLTVAAWNIEAGARGGQRAAGGVQDVGVDLLGLEELQPQMSDALLADEAITARFPYRVLAPDDSVYGIGLLSRFRIIEQSASNRPTFLRALVDLPGSERPLAVFVVHPLPARIDSVAGLPVSLDPSYRDADLDYMRAQIDIDLGAGRPVLVLGDLNTTERELAYADFSTGLRDAHLDAGFGPGLTWRPDELKSLPLGVLRIDYVFSSPDLVARSSEVSCNGLSDHCLVLAGF